MYLPGSGTPIDQIFLTALPNGLTADGKMLRISLLVTPSLKDNAALIYPFTDWPSVAQTLKWTVTFTNPDHSNISPAISAPIDLAINPESIPSQGPQFDSGLWANVFQSVKVKQRTGHNRLHRTWRLSHNVTRLHKRHQAHRLAHAYSQFVASKNIDLRTANFTQLHKDTGPPQLFLHPQFGDSANSELTLRIDDRKNVEPKLKALVAALPNTPDPKFPAIVQKRVDYAVGKLETYGGAGLSAAALSAVYISCLQSAGPAGAQLPPAVAAAISTTISIIQNWFSSSSFIKASYHELHFGEVPHYLEMLLFHRRSAEKATEGPICPPDFHQLLGMVLNYPAIMRPLGLVFDFVFIRPTGLPASCAVAISLDAHDVPSQKLSSAITVNPCFTQCTIESNTFCATPRDANLIKNGLLNLQAHTTADPTVDRFTLVPENADGQALKLTDQYNNASRATEYATSAPTAMNAPDAQPQPVGEIASTPRSAPNPSTAAPSPRTVGLALFDHDRMANAEQIAGGVADNGAGNSPTPPAPVPPTDFYAEDLVLGYRVDVLYRQRFFSLCQRSSIYKICLPRTENTVGTWKPTSPLTMRADEGFLSFGATESPLVEQGVTTDPAETQTQIHQTVFTWTGWSLSVPAPKFPSMNPASPPNASDSAQSKHLAIQPDYSLPDGVKLPPLRFDTDYQVRCRVADLAGNSVPPDFDPNNEHYFKSTIAPLTQFSRHEPIRAPQFVLIRPIDRVNQPGTHIDRMVARDNDSESVRMLVPPRESLRLAELSGYLTDARLPKGAFPGQQLLADGSFPSIACAKDKHWIAGEIQEPGDNDPIFLRNSDRLETKNRYYPDPLAKYIRIEIFELTDDPSQSRLLKIVWLKIEKKDEAWSQRLPVRIRLIPHDSGGHPSIKVEQNSAVEDDIGVSVAPTLDVQLPRGSTVVLRISSAAVDPTSPEQAGEYPVHLWNLCRLHATTMPRLASSLVTGPAGHQLDEIAEDLATRQGDPLLSSHVFVDGTLDITNPKRVMTLVHAVKKPLAATEFGPPGSSGALSVERGLGKPEAQVAGDLKAHWLSTSKITCYAEWSDEVDDVTKDKPICVHHREVAFVATAKEFSPDTPSPATRFRILNKSVVQHFLDTRAHKITYKLVATTNFREYYPGAEKPKADDEHFQLNGNDPVNLTVLSSVRPPAPSIAYVLPAFAWANTYDREKKIWHAGRTVVLRVYLKRPFLVSGDRETLGVVLADNRSGVDPAQQNFVSRWGADPAREITTPIQQNELAEDNLCEQGAAVETCMLTEGDPARVKPCAIQYSCERKLWYSDIPINTKHSNAPFVRLALVRWQPDSLSGASESRCSQVAFADFMQISPDRWVSVQKNAKSKYEITISGAFASKNTIPPFTLTLQKRWYALGSDTGWRPVSCPTNFHYTGPSDDNGVSNWSTELCTPPSFQVSRYRIFLAEEEFPGQAARKSFSIFIELP